MIAATSEAVMAALANIASSVSIILVNKQIVSVCNFHFVLTVLFLNFLSTCSFLECVSRLGWFEVKHLPPRDRWLIALMAVCTVLLNNASNEANSVGFYQITKLLIIPTVMAIERIGGTTVRYSAGVLCSLCVASVGVGVATVSDLELNVRGSILSFLSILCTAQYQLWQKGKQHEHGLTAMQITHSATGPQVVIGFVASLVFDVLFPSLKELMLLRSGGLLDHRLRGPEDIAWIVVCCVVAVAMNISTYNILGKVTPVTYQVIGQLKTSLIVALGFIFFDAKGPAFWLAIRFAGVGVAVVGISFYFAAKNADERRKRDDEQKRAN